MTLATDQLSSWPMQANPQERAPREQAGEEFSPIRLIQGAIFDTPEFKFLPSVVLLSVLMNGLWLSPAAIRMFQYSQNPYTNPFRNNSDWLLENYLLPWLANVIGANGSVLSYAVFCLALLVLGLLAVYFLALQQAGRDVARSLAVVWLISPTSLIVQGSIGYADTITVIAASALGLKRSRLALTIPLSFAMGLNHWGQGVVILCLITAGHLAISQTDRLRRMAWFAANLVALFAGVYLLRVIFAANGVEPSMDRVGYFTNLGPYFFFQSATKSWGIFLYSTLGVLWFLFHRYMGIPELRGKLLFAALFLAALGVTLFTRDQTRVFAMLSWPLVIMMVEQLWSAERSARHPVGLRRVLGVTAVLGLLIPKVAVWDGRPYGSLFYHDVIVAIEAVRDPGTLRWEDNRWVAKAFNR